MLDIPQQNPLKYGFSGIEYIANDHHTKGNLIHNIVCVNLDFCCFTMDYPKISLEFKLIVAHKMKSCSNPSLIEVGFLFITFIVLPYFFVRSIVSYQHAKIFITHS